MTDPVLTLTPASSREVSHAERIAVLEKDVEVLEEKLDIINSKLTTLVEFHQRGVGAFWLASTIFGTGIIAAVISFFKVFK